MAFIHDIIVRASKKFSDSVGAFRVISLDDSGDNINLATAAKQDEIIAKLASYATSDIDEASATVTYIGKMDADGAWMVMKIGSSSGTAFTYATELNNATVTSYADAWTARATLTYGTYSEAF